MDDDRNGRIDDGCPCAPGETQACFVGEHANRGVGACRNGVQTCNANGTEWSDWGNSQCEGGREPMEEACDGTDRDCDGAVDEGCPCTVGDSRECGLEFLTAPCRGGTQSCRANGTWTSCEGAIGPTEDVCDGIDNDCDGTADVGCGCESPEPERCRDEIDNDCDGEIDEPACMPDWPCSSVRCLEAPSANVPDLLGMNGIRINLTSDGTRLVTSWVGKGPEGTGTDQDAHIAFMSADGRVERDLILGQAAAAPSIEWNGAELAVAWLQKRPVTAEMVFTRIGTDGTILGNTRMDPGQLAWMYPQIARGSGGLAVAWQRLVNPGVPESQTFALFQRVSSTGEPQGPVVMLGANNVFPTSMVPFQDGFLIGVGITAPNDFHTLSAMHYVVNDAVVWSVDLPGGPHGDTSGAVVAASCDRVLACWREYFDARTTPNTRHRDLCQAFDPSGRAVSTPTAILDSPKYGDLVMPENLDVIWADGQFLVHSEAVSDTTGNPLQNQERFVAINRNGDQSWAFYPTERVGHRGQGDVTLMTDGCAIGVSTAGQQVAPDGAFTGSNMFRIRRICETECR
jgi:hypothetical protein